MGGTSSNANQFDGSNLFPYYGMPLMPYPQQQMQMQMQQQQMQQQAAQMPQPQFQPQPQYAPPFAGNPYQPSISTTGSFPNQEYLVFALSVTLIIMLILWKKNPALVQQPQRSSPTDLPDANLVGHPSLAKISLLGIGIFIFVMLGSPILNNKEEIQ